MNNIINYMLKIRRIKKLYFFPFLGPFVAHFSLLSTKVFDLDPPLCCLRFKKSFWTPSNLWVNAACITLKTRKVGFFRVLGPFSTLVILPKCAETMYSFVESVKNKTFNGFNRQI